MGSAFSFQSNQVAGAVRLTGVAPVFSTSYGFDATNTNNFGIIATISNNDNIGAIPVLTFPVAGGSSTVSCTHFNNGVLPQQGAATNVLTCSIPNTSIAPGTVTVGFRYAGGQSTYSFSYAFLVAPTPATNTVTVTSPLLVTQSATTVPSSTVTETTFEGTVTRTNVIVEVLNGASATSYVSCSRSSTSTTSPRTSSSSSSTSRQGPTTTSGRSQPTACNRDNCLRQFVRSSVQVAPFCKQFTTTRYTGFRGPIPTFVSACGDSVSRVSSACSCLARSTDAAQIRARQRAVTQLPPGFSPPDFTYSAMDAGTPVVFVTGTVTVVATVTLADVTSGVTTTTVNGGVVVVSASTTRTEDQRTVTTVNTCT